MLSEKFMMPRLYTGGAFMPIAIPERLRLMAHYHL
jgi:hypothetical protein